MAHHDFWRGFNTAILMIAVLRLCWLINIYICGVAVAVVAFALLHNFLTNVRNYLQQKQQLRKAKEIAKALYSDNGKISIRFLEIHQHVGLNHIKHGWVAGVGSAGTAKGNFMLIKTKIPALTKDQALDHLHKILAKELIKNAAELPAATETEY